MLPHMGADVGSRDITITGSRSQCYSHGQLTVDSPQVLHITMDLSPEKVIGCLQMSHATENFGPLATSTRLPL